MSDGPLESTIAVAGLVAVSLIGVWKGQLEVALAGVAALAAYLGTKAVHRPSA